MKLIGFGNVWLFVGFGFSIFVSLKGQLRLVLSKMAFVKQS